MKQIEKDLRHDARKMGYKGKKLNEYVKNALNLPLEEVKILVKSSLTEKIAERIKKVFKKR